MVSQNSPVQTEVERFTYDLAAFLELNCQPTSFDETTRSNDAWKLSKGKDVRANVRYVPDNKGVVIHERDQRVAEQIKQFNTSRYELGSIVP